LVINLFVPLIHFQTDKETKGIRLSNPLEHFNTEAQCTQKKGLVALVNKIKNNLMKSATLARRHL